MGAESLILLGFAESVLPARSALRKLGALIRSLEEGRRGTGADDDGRSTTAPHVPDRSHARADEARDPATIDDYYLGWYDADGDRMAQAAPPGAVQARLAAGSLGRTASSTATPATRWSTHGRCGQGRRSDPAGSLATTCDVSDDLRRHRCGRRPCRAVRRLPPSRPDAGRLADPERAVVSGLTLTAAGSAARSAAGPDAARAVARPPTRTRPGSSSATASGSSGSATATGQPDDPPDADVVDRPLAPLEAPDPLPRPPLPGRDVRRPRQRPIRPAAGRRRPTPTREFVADAIAVLDATGTDRAVVGRPVDGRGLRGPAGGRPSRTACSASCLFGARPSRSATASPTSRDAAPTRRSSSRSRTTTAGTSTTPTTGAATGRASPRWFVGREDLLRAALDEGDRGHRRLVPRDRPGDDDHRRARAVPVPPADWERRADRGRRAARSCAASRCPALVVHGTDDHIIGDRRRRRLAGAARRPARRDRGRRPLPDRPRSGPRQPADPRLRAVAWRRRP